MDIEKNIALFISGQGKNKGRRPDERYASFDYCFNYFQSFRKDGKMKNLSSSRDFELSCLHLGFYLASWGMLRGSSFLLEKSLKHYRPLIEGIAAFDPAIWEIDVEDYGRDSAIDLLFGCRDMIAESLGEKNRVSDTLVTKIMLGVFGNVPAFDTQFKKGFGVSTFGKKSLRKIFGFYQANRVAIDSYKIHTFDFISGQETSVRYTHAKIIDMIGFVEGT
jgi:hypothetical protein